MKLRFEKIPIAQHHSIHVLALEKAQFDAPWHFHPEWELTLIQHGRGKRFVGSNIEPFDSGDLVLLGPDLPHFWHSEKAAIEPRADDSRAIVVQFRAEFPGENFLKLPELTPIRQLLQRGVSGLVFSGNEASEAAVGLERLAGLDPLGTLLGLLSVLALLAKAQSRPLSQSHYTSPMEQDASTRLGKAYAYLVSHFHESITLEDVARAAAMSPAAFSRFFKRMSQRNLWDLLNELRVDHASRLLRETQRGITEIAFESGFGTLSSFNRHFRQTHKRTPRDYRKVLQSGQHTTPPEERRP
jgi:AraC-like DNA-binding protein